MAVISSCRAWDNARGRDRNYVLHISSNDAKRISIMSMTMLKKTASVTAFAPTKSRPQCDSPTLHFQPDSWLNSGKLHQVSVSCIIEVHGANVPSTQTPTQLVTLDLLRDLHLPAQPHLIPCV